LQKVDGLMEERLKQGGQKIIGTTKQGIGPAYTSKAMRNAVRVGHLLNREALHTRLRRLVEDTRRMYDVEIDAEEEVAKADAVADRVRGMIVDGQHMIHAALQGGKRIIAEGANAAMLDLDFGTYPYVTSSTTTAGGVCTGLGIPPSRLEAVVGVVKAYTTRVGGGPFPTELTDERGGGDRPLHSEGTDVGLHLQKVGAEVGVT
jgi:adenylosuccinate synthase